MCQNLEMVPRAYISRNDAPTNEPVKITDYLPNMVTISASPSSQGLLVLADTWYPGWKAFVDGQEVPVERYHSIFRSVHIEPGEHEVVFKFKPKSFYLGALTSLITIVVLLAFLVLSLKKNLAFSPK